MKLNILAAPMGYNAGGRYGSPILDTGGKGAPAPEPPANLSELSDKDAMNMLDMMRKEVNVDDKRTYLMGTRWGAREHFTWNRSMHRTGPPLPQWLRPHSGWRPS